MAVSDDGVAADGREMRIGVDPTCRHSRRGFGRYVLSSRVLIFLGPSRQMGSIFDTTNA